MRVCKLLINTKQHQMENTLKKKKKQSDGNEQFSIVKIYTDINDFMVSLNIPIWLNITIGVALGILANSLARILLLLQ